MTFKELAIGDFFVFVGFDFDGGSDSYYHPLMKKAGENEARSMLSGSIHTGSGLCNKLVTAIHFDRKIIATV